MFQLFLRARAQSYFRGRLGDQGFRARSAGRDAETDSSRVGSILEAIEDALRAAEQEQAGLSGRVEDVLARAAVTFGNDTDEYLCQQRSDFGVNSPVLFCDHIASPSRSIGRSETVKNAGGSPNISDRTRRCVG
jgi:hypothetical protein